MIYGVSTSPSAANCLDREGAGLPPVKGRLRGDLTAVPHCSVVGYSEERARGAQGRDRRWWIQIAARECLHHESG